MSVQTEKITKERLAGWANRLKEEHSTPLLLIAIGHDEKAGQLTICVPEGVEDDLLIGSLLYVLESLKPGLIPKHHSERAVFTCS